MGRNKSPIRCLRMAQDIWGLILFVIGAPIVIVATIVAYVQHIRELPNWWQILFLLGFSLVLLGTIGIILKWVSKGHGKQMAGTEAQITPKVEFYPDRAAMLEKRCLDTELRDEKVIRLWVAFESGSHYNTVNDKDVHKIEKMVLLHPECDWTRQFVEKLGDRVTSGRFVASIKDAARKAMGHRTLVRYSETPIMNVVIADPEDERADSWARVNVFLPHLTADRWPTFVIYRSKEPTLFGVIKDAYDEMWKNSKEPS
jgi:hypothetical protein